MGQAQPKNKNKTNTGRPRPKVNLGRDRPNNFYGLGQDRPRFVRLGQHRAGPASSPQRGEELIFFPPASCNQNRGGRRKFTWRGGSSRWRCCGGVAVSWLRGRQRCGCSQAADRRDFLPLPSSLSFFVFFSFPSLLFVFCFLFFCFRFIPFPFPLPCSFSLSPCVS